MHRGGKVKGTPTSGLCPLTFTCPRQGYKVAVLAHEFLKCRVAEEGSLIFINEVLLDDLRAMILWEAHAFYSASPFFASYGSNGQRGS